jgi:tetratricopeptide (TPR) repeat protein
MVIALIGTSKARVWCLGLVSVAVVGAAIAAAGAGWYRVTRPDYRLRQGQKALLQGDLNRAEDFAQRLEESGHADEAHLLRGQSLLRRGRLNEAILEYNQIHQENQDVLGEASLIYGLGFLSVGDYIRAERLLRYVLTVRPQDLEAHRGLARICYDRGAMNQALVYLDKWSQLDDRDGEPHRWKAMIYKDIGIDSMAVENYQAALGRELPPQTRAQVVVELVEVLIKQRDYQQAISYLDEQFTAGESPPAVAELRAECLFFGQRRSGEAVALLQQARGNEAPSPHWLWLRSQLHADASELPAAIDLLQQALSADPHDIACRYSLAEAYERLGRRTEAAEERGRLEQSRRLLQQLSDLNREAADKPRDAQVRRRLADVCEKLGKLDMAQAWLRAARACGSAQESGITNQGSGIRNQENKPGG